MQNIFRRKNQDIKEAKDLILRTFFNADTQKEAVTRAAKESAEDQRRMLQRAKLKLGTK
ncbi:MAG: hypothetical protein Q7S48_00585 [bacterium]|nr:hypothetical protein [bacterium]